ncbi:MAG TPA: hypothetical protein VGB91_17290 [Rhizomicrobium sp.]
MSVSRNEAQGALRDIERTARRSFSAQSYRQAAPFLILWGVLWMIGYGGTEYDVHLANPIWLSIFVAGTAASTLIGMRVKSGARKFDVRIFIAWLASLGFFIAILAVIGPVSGPQMGAIIPLIVAWAYVVMGAWMGWRLVFAGTALGALTLFGFFCWPQHFAGWMAVVGGGTLVGTGLWLRRA